MLMLAKIQITAAPKTSENVTGAASMICGITCTPRFEYDSISRLTTIRSIIVRYWTGSGRSSPKFERIAASVSGVALRPAIWRAGSIPGVAKKIRNTITLSANSTTIIEAILRSANAIMPVPAYDDADATSRGGRARHARHRQGC